MSAIKAMARKYMKKNKSSVLRIINRLVVSRKPNERAEQISIISKSKYFDSHWYLETYHDVQMEGIEPALHYFLHGSSEDRNPGPNFDAALYKNKFGYAMKDEKNPILHYENFGKSLGFTIEIDDYSQSDLNFIVKSPLFDADWYQEMYADSHDVASPAVHYLVRGGKEGRDPGPNFSSSQYYKMYPSVEAAGMNPLLHYEQHGRSSLLTIAKATDYSAFSQIKDFYKDTLALQIYHIKRDKRRLHLVTDSISKGSLFGGVGTSIIMGVMLANKIGFTFSIITTKEVPDRSTVQDLLELHGIKLLCDIELKYININDPYSALPVDPSDLYLTTSWWTTHSTLASIDPSKIIYVLQEDERMFYPLGMKHLLATEAMTNKDITIVVNSKLLFDHLKTSGVINLQSNAIYFEPAFSQNVYFPENDKTRDGQKFAFYARPHNDRNLYIRGLEAIELAISEGIINPDECEIVFMGKDLGPIKLAGKYRPKFLQNVTWSKYGEFIRSVDVCLSLMYTPHPSYPPLDVAASGGIAVTNKFGLKNSLSQYSDNIICVELSTDSIVEGIRNAFILANNKSKRSYNYNSNQILRSWETSFEHVVTSIAKKVV